MRERLAAIAGLRTRFRGRFVRFGTATVKFWLNGDRRSKEVSTLVLEEITDDRGNPLTDHLWFKVGKQFESLDLQPGDRIEFTARVESYRKRARDDEGSYLAFDYCLKRPTNMVKLGVHDGAGRGLLFADAFPDGPK